jgi:hypothetical protein
MGLVGAVWGTVLVLLPEGVGRALLADNWPAANALLPLLAIAATGRGVTAGFAGGLRALGEVRDILSIRVVIAPVSVLAGVGGAVLFGASGAAAAFALTTVLSAALYGRGFLRGAEEQERQRGASLASTTRAQVANPPS